MPVLWANYQEQVTKSALKKNYAVLSNALEYYYIRNGETLYSSDLTGHTLKSKIIGYFNVIKDCGYYDCYYLNKNEYKSYNGSQTITYNYFDDGQFILSDGTFVAIENRRDSGEDDEDDAYGYSKYISVDINGLYKKPNRLGRDLFMFQLDKSGKLLPMGADGTDYTGDSTYCSNSSTSTMNGASCTYKILKKK